MDLCILTDWLGLVPFGFALAFGVTGLCQGIGRKALRKVDFSILALGVFYLVVCVMATAAMQFHGGSANRFCAPVWT